MTERELKQLIRRKLRQVNKQFKGKFLDAPININTIDIYIEFFSSNAKKTSTAIMKRHGASLYLLEVVRLTFFQYSISINEHHAIFHENEKYLDNEGMVIANMLQNYCNSLESIHLLLSKGYARDARILLRSLYELAYIIIIVLNDKDLFHKYVDMGKDESNSIWYKYFKPKELQKELDKILNKFKGLDSVAKSFKDSYYFYSGIAHNGFIETMMSAYYMKDINSEYMNIAISGENSTYIKSTLNALMDLNLIFLMLITHTITNRSIIKFNTKVDNELFSIYLYEISVDAIIKLKEWAEMK